MAEAPDILVVEDDSIDRLAIRRAFERRRMGPRLRFAPDGESALSILTEGPDQPRFVLLDLALPRMNGLELLMALRRVRPSLCPRVIVLTTSRNPAEVDLARAQGVRHFLHKDEVGLDYGRLFPLLEGPDGSGGPKSGDS